MEENNSQRKRYDSSERRKTPRLERKLIVQYRIKELSRSGREQASVEPSVDITQTKDLSEGGIFFTADKIIPPQTVLDLKLRLPTQKEAFNLEGRVVGCDEIEKNIIYGIRVEFFNLDHKQKVVLQNFMQLFLKGNK